MAKLTKRFVDGARPAEKEYIIFDDDLPRFGLRVLPSGTKSYLVQYRHHGRTRRFTIGKHGPITPDRARRAALGLLAEVAGGTDPSSRRHADRQAPTVARACERFLHEYVSVHCKPTTQREYRRSVELFILPAIGRRKIGQISAADIARLHHDLGHIPYQANRTVGVLSKLFNLCELWGLRPDGSNPCRRVKKYPETKHERFLSGEELRQLGQVLDEASRDGSETASAIAAIRLLVLTGCRLSEILTLRWSYIDGGVLRLPDSKTGKKVVPLGRAAIETLAGIERRPDNPFVITGRRTGAHLTDLQHPWRRIRKRAGLDDVRIHDLRPQLCLGGRRLRREPGRDRQASGAQPGSNDREICPSGTRPGDRGGGPDLEPHCLCIGSA